MHAYNEWDPLEEIIVGRPENAHVPPLTAEVAATSYEHNHDVFATYAGKPFPKDAIEKATAEVNNFCEVLRQEGVIVRQPEVVDHGKEYSTPDHSGCFLFKAHAQSSACVIS